MNIEALLFDMDGVLIRSIDSWHQALNAAMEEYGHERLSKEEFENKFWGGNLSVILESLGLNQGIGHFCLDIYPEYVDNIEIFNDTISTLEKLSMYTKSIVTNTSLQCTNHILKRFDLEKYFDLVMTSDQVKRGKPYPDMLERACSILGTDPDHVVMIGDTDMDIRAANAAGCIVIGVGIEGDYSIKTLSALPELIKEITVKK